MPHPNQTCGSCMHYQRHSQIAVPGDNMPDPRLGTCLGGPPQVVAIIDPTQKAPGGNVQVNFVARYPELPPNFRACACYQELEEANDPQP